MTETFGRTYSLRRRLLLLIGGPILLAAMLAGILAFDFASHHVQQTYDAEMLHMASVLLQLTEHEILEGDDPSIELTDERIELSHHHEKFIVFRIWYKDRLVTESSIADILQLGRVPAGFSDQMTRAHRWRFFSFLDPKSGITVDIGQRAEVRAEVMKQILISLVSVLALMMPLCLAVIWFGATRGLKPLIRLSRAVDTRNAQDLTPIVFTPVSDEVTPLLTALNRLFLRLGHTLQRERELTDNAAHELRTPLAAMKMNLQLLQRDNRLAAPDCDQLNTILEATDRAAEMVGQLLLLSRLENAELSIETLDLSALIEKVAVEMAGAASHHHIETSIDPGIMMLGNAAALQILIRNLLDNAMKFTPQNGKIRLALRARDDDKIFSIQDSGPGISDAHKDKVFQRFYRIDKSARGSGLGLALVKWAADAHFAAITLHDGADGGLLVDVIFPGA